MFTAGYNMPGCLPENDPVSFDCFGCAVSYLLNEIDRFWDEDNDISYDVTRDIDCPDNADAKWLDIHTALHNIGNDVYHFTGFAGGYTFWIEGSHVNSMAVQ